MTKQDQANLWTAAECTLDGKRAIVSGRLNPFASVQILGHPAYSVEFAWATVDHIMTFQEGKFRS